MKKKSVSKTNCKHEGNLRIAKTFFVDEGYTIVGENKIEEWADEEFYERTPNEFECYCVICKKKWTVNSIEKFPKYIRYRYLVAEGEIDPEDE